MRALHRTHVLYGFDGCLLYTSLLGKAHELEHLELQLGIVDAHAATAGLKAVHDLSLIHI